MPKIKIVDQLTDAQREQLLSWIEDFSYAETKKLAARPIADGGFGVVISAGTLCRFYTTHNIADAQSQRVQYLSSAGLDPSALRHPKAALINASEDQLQLRLLELASRPNPGASELRALFQIITRLRALKLSERRVRLAEARETRLASQTNIQTQCQAPDYSEPQTREEMVQAIRNVIGKDIVVLDEDVPPPARCQRDSTNAPSPQAKHACAPAYFPPTLPENSEP